MAINKSVPVTATVITRRVDPGFYTRRVGQTISAVSPVQWMDQDGTNIGSPSRFLLLTSAMQYEFVQAGIGGTKYLVLPEAATLPTSTDVTPATSRMMAVNRNGLYDYDAARPIIDWMKMGRMTATYSGLLQTELNGVTTSVVVQSAIPSDLPQTGTLTLGSTEVSYTAWSGSTFTITSTDFTANVKTVGSAVTSLVSMVPMQGTGVLDSNFWPNRTPNFASNIQILWADVTSSWAGEYFNVTWTGTGDVSSSLSFTNISSTGANHRRIRAATSIGAAGLNHQIQTTGQVSNITIIPERYATEYTAGERFRPELIEFYSKIRQVRMMDWGRTNGSTTTDWSQRSLESHAVWTTSTGVPLETMVDFAEAAGINEIWFCVPHEATNAYVTSFGEWLEANIPSGMTVYVELSNECWNSAFDQTLYFRAIALSEWATNFREMDAYGRRAAEVMYLIGQEFTGSLVRVCGVQVASTTTTTNALTSPLWNADNGYYSDSLSLQMSAPHNYFDAVAVTNYIYANLTDSATVTAMRAAYAISDEAGHQFLFDKFMEQGLGLQQADGWLRDQRTVIDNYSLRMIGYEGGNHAVYTVAGGTNAPPSDANLTENLEYLYSFYESEYYAEVFYHLWRMWENIADGPFMQFSDVGEWFHSGVWTLARNLDDPMLPVHQVANALSRTRPQWWT